MPLKRICKRLGLGNVTQHRLRATFATLHAQESTPITEIKGMLGHKSITTTMIYIEQSLESKRKAQDTLSQKLGFV
jgi:integrase